MSAFTPYVSEQLKAYVYLLIDPRDGEVADELAHYRNTSVRHLFKQGESSPFKYVNC